MEPFINFAKPVPVLTAVALFILVVYLAKETKKSWITAFLLGLFLTIIIGHALELAILSDKLASIKNMLAISLTYDFMFIFLSFFSYLWIDDIEAKDGKKKSIDDSLSWFWSKV